MTTGLNMSGEFRIGDKVFNRAKTDASYKTTHVFNYKEWVLTITLDPLGDRKQPIRVYLHLCRTGTLTGTFALVVTTCSKVRDCYTRILEYTVDNQLHMLLSCVTDEALRGPLTSPWPSSTVLNCAFRYTGYMFPEHTDDGSIEVHTRLHSPFRSRSTTRANLDVRGRTVVWSWLSTDEKIERRLQILAKVAAKDVTEQQGVICDVMRYTRRLFPHQNMSRPR